MGRAINQTLAGVVVVGGGTLDFFLFEVLLVDDDDDDFTLLFDEYNLREPSGEMFPPLPLLPLFCFFSPFIILEESGVSFTGDFVGLVLLRCFLFLIWDAST